MFCSQPGDIMALLFEGDFCFTMRQKGEHYELVADAYVHGLMKSETFKGLADAKMPESQVYTLC